MTLSDVRAALTATNHECPIVTRSTIRKAQPLPQGLTVDIPIEELHQSSGLHLPPADTQIDRDVNVFNPPNTKDR